VGFSLRFGGLVNLALFRLLYSRLVPALAEVKKTVMLSLPKHLSRFVATSLITTAVEMLRQAQHDGRM
jgi:hypothetical protein